MKIKVLGIENDKKWSIDNGPSFDGKYVFGEKIDEIRPNLIGNDVITLKIQKNQPVYGVDLEIGKSYTVYFNDKKQVDFIAPYSK